MTLDKRFFVAHILSSEQATTFIRIDPLEVARFATCDSIQSLINHLQNLIKSYNLEGVR